MACLACSLPTRASFWLVQSEGSCLAPFYQPSAGLLLRKLSSDKTSKLILDVTDKIIQRMPANSRDHFAVGDSVYLIDESLYRFRGAGSSFYMLDESLHGQVLLLGGYPKDLVTAKKFALKMGGVYQPASGWVKEFLTDPSGRWKESRAGRAYVFDRAVSLVLEEGESPINLRVKLQLDLEEKKFETTLRSDSRVDFAGFMTSLDEFFKDRNRSKTMHAFLIQNHFTHASVSSPDLEEFDRFIEEIVSYLNNL